MWCVCVHSRYSGGGCGGGGEGGGGGGQRRVWKVPARGDKPDGGGSQRLAGHHMHAATGWRQRHKPCGCSGPLRGAIPAPRPPAAELAGSERKGRTQVPAQRVAWPGCRQPPMPAERACGVRRDVAVCWGPWRPGAGPRGPFPIGRRPPRQGRGGFQDGEGGHDPSRHGVQLIPPKKLTWKWWACPPIWPIEM